MEITKSHLIFFFIFLFFCFLFYNQHLDLKYAQDTVRIQDNAITKQQSLINHQKRYIHLLESYESYKSEKSFPKRMLPI